MNTKGTVSNLNMKSILDDRKTTQMLIEESESGNSLGGGEGKDVGESGDVGGKEHLKRENSGFTIKVLDPGLTDGPFPGPGLGFGTSPGGAKTQKKEKKGKIQVKTTTIQGVREARGPTSKIDMYNKGGHHVDKVLLNHLKPSFSDKLVPMGVYELLVCSPCHKTILPNIIKP